MEKKQQWKICKILFKLNIDGENVRLKPNKIVIFDIKPDEELINKLIKNFINIKCENNMIIIDMINFNNHIRQLKLERLIK